MSSNRGMAGSPPKGRVYGGLTAEERQVRRRAQFVAAGLEVFGTTGFRTATVRAICRQAGLTDRYFYESFGDKEDLLLAVYLDCIARFQAAVAPVLEAWAVDTDPRTALDAGLDLYFRWVEDPKVARVVWQEVLGVSDRVDAVYAVTMRTFATTLLDAVRTRDLDWTDSEAAEMIAVAATGALVQAAMQWRIEGHATPRATMVAATRRVLLGLQVAVE